MGIHLRAATRHAHMVCGGEGRREVAHAGRRCVWGGRSGGGDRGGGDGEADQSADELVGV